MGRKNKKEKDSRGRLEETPFEYRAAKDGKVFISWQGREVMVLKGGKAEAFLKRVERMDERGRQLAMAKITGNFKRGNERGK